MHRRLVIPKGDFLVHAGDLTGRGTWAEFKDFVEWLAEQPHPIKIFTAGNHDKVCENELRRCLDLVEKTPGVHMLIDKARAFEGLKFYGSPWTPQFCNWSFMKDRGAPIRQVWKKIPADVDILITHGPPYGHNDLAPPYYSPNQQAVGCFELLQQVRTIKPKLHIFGHIHEGYGRTESAEIPTRFVNASICTGNYQPTNTPQIINIQGNT